jgi:hypothetical protein
MKEIKKGEESLDVEEQEGNEVMGQLSDAERGRLKTVKEMLAVKELPDYGRREEAAAKKLNLSKRSMKRLVKGMNEVGSMSVICQVRSDSHHESAGGSDGEIDEAEMVDRPHSVVPYCRSVFGGDGRDRNRAEGVWVRCDVWSRFPRC